MLDACAAIGYTPHSAQSWSHHNYSDVEGRVATRVQLLRDRLRGRWVGRTDVSGAPNVWITEGGARPSKLKTLYPGEDPLAAQARCLQTSWDLLGAAAGGGAGVSMIGAVPALRRPELGLRVAGAGAVDGQAPVVCHVEGVPEADVRRSVEEIEAVRRAKARLDRLGFYPSPVRIGRVRVLSVPWVFRLPWFRRFHGYTLWPAVILLRGSAGVGLRRPHRARALPRVADAAPPDRDAAVVPVAGLREQPQRDRGAGGGAEVRSSRRLPADEG